MVIRNVMTVVAVLISAALGASAAYADDFVAGYLGSWSGKGQVVFKNGNSERINCRAYNTGDPANLRMALRCASPAYKIEIRSKLDVVGASMTGTWEERTYNVSGAVKGTVGTNGISLNVDGGVMRGDMAIAKSGSNALSVNVETAGIDLKSVTVRLARLSN